MIFPERTTNLVRGKGFHDNDYVLQQFVEAGKYQEALDYFGFEGRYEPEHPQFQKSQEPAFTDPKTGNIYYSQYPFEGNYHRLLYSALHEMKHSTHVKTGKYDNVEITPYISSQEEYDTYVYNYKNEGLYLNSGIDTYSRIKYYEYRMFSDTFQKRWYHIVYKTPRKW